MSQHTIKIKEIIRIAKEAGEIAMHFYDKEYFVEEKRDKTPLTAADKAIHDFLIEKLATYNYPILSEEGEDDFEKRKNAEYMWIIDPLDGTSDFIQKTGDFSILIGLVKDHKSVLGVVYEPVKKTIYWAEKEKGAYMEKNGETQRIYVSEKGSFSDMTILLSRNHLLETDVRLCNDLQIGRQKKRGSTSKMCVIARGDAEIYVNTSDRTAEWDTCAVNAVLTEAGGKITDTKNDPIIYNRNNPVHCRGFIASNRRKHEDIVRELKNIIG